MDESEAGTHVLSLGPYVAFRVLVCLAKETLREECATFPQIIDLVSLCFVTQVGSDAFYHPHHILSVMWAL